MASTIFYSWQSDIRPGAACRGFIELSLKGAAANIAQDQALEVDPAIERDTQNVPGSPDIGATIFAKIKSPRTETCQNPSGGNPGGRHL